MSFSQTELITVSLLFLLLVLTSRVEDPNNKSQWIQAFGMNFGKIKHFTFFGIEIEWLDAVFCGWATTPVRGCYCRLPQMTGKSKTIKLLEQCAWSWDNYYKEMAKCYWLKFFNGILVVVDFWTLVYYGNCLAQSQNHWQHI